MLPLWCGSLLSFLTRFLCTPTLTVPPSAAPAYRFASTAVTLCMVSLRLVQPFLVTLRFDGYITSDWSIVFLPTWAIAFCGLGCAIVTLSLVKYVHSGAHVRLKETAVILSYITSVQILICAVCVMCFLVRLIDRLNYEYDSSRMSESSDNRNHDPFKILWPVLLMIVVLLAVNPIFAKVSTDYEYYLEASAATLPRWNPSGVPDNVRRTNSGFAGRLPMFTEHRVYWFLQTSSNTYYRMQPTQYLAHHNQFPEPIKQFLTAKVLSKNETTTGAIKPLKLNSDNNTFWGSSNDEQDSQQTTPLLELHNAEWSQTPNSHLFSARENSKMDDDLHGSTELTTLQSHSDLAFSAGSMPHKIYVPPGTSGGNFTSAGNKENCSREPNATQIASAATEISNIGVVTGNPDGNNAQSIDVENDPCSSGRASVSAYRGNTQTMDLQDTCVVCLSARASCIFQGCGHAVTCLQCGLLVASQPVASARSCPICRTVIESVHEVSYPPFKISNLDESNNNTLSNSNQSKILTNLEKRQIKVVLSTKCHSLVRLVHLNSERAVLSM